MRNILCILFLSLLFFMCKKVTKKVNSEKIFQVFVVDSAASPVSKCYDRVWAKGRADIDPCTYSTEGIKLPLNIAADSSVFYFKSGAVVDSLSISYKKRFEPTAGEFEVVFEIQNLTTSFRNIDRKCISNLTPSCNGDKASLSAVIYQ